MTLAKRNPWFDMVVEVFGEPMGNEGVYGRLAWASQKAGHEPDEIRRAALRYAKAWGVSRLTVAALLKHYGRWTGPLADLSDEDVDAARRLDEELRLVEKARRAQQLRLIEGSGG